MKLTDSIKPEILAVDDEEKNLRLIEAMLAPEGYTVTFATNGLEAIKYLENNIPDLILLDIMMPVMDGYEVARRIKQDDRTKIIPIVMVTSLNEVDDRVKALDAGADDFLSKPLDITELRARVRSMLKVKSYNDFMVDYRQLLELEVRERTEQLQQALDRAKFASLETIYRLSRAAEYRDEGTGSHIQRVSRYAAAVAKEMGLDEDFIESILYAVPMHDIGKIGIPDHILLKPGPLDTEERRIIEQHCTFGAKILENSDSELIRLAETISLTHHERWDGKGYPYGLKGNEIPLEGRLSAIADVFDALTSKRPYRDALPIHEAMDYILKNRGTQFDPDLSDIFIELTEQIKQIKKDL